MGETASMQAITTSSKNLLEGSRFWQGWLRRVEMAAKTRSKMPSAPSHIPEYIGNGGNGI
jgi:hypothetical protein